MRRWEVITLLAGAAAGVRDRANGSAAEPRDPRRSVGPGGARLDRGPELSPRCSGRELSYRKRGAVYRRARTVARRSHRRVRRHHRFATCPGDTDGTISSSARGRSGAQYPERTRQRRARPLVSARASRHSLAFGLAEPAGTLDHPRSGTVSRAREYS